MKFKLSPIAIFFVSSILITVFFTAGYIFAYLTGTISTTLFYASIFSEFFFLFFDLIFIYSYVLYVSKYPETKKNKNNETHILIAVWLGKVFPTKFDVFLLDFVFPFYRKYLMRYTAAFNQFVAKLYSFATNWVSKPATFIFIFILLISFNFPLLYFFYNLDCLLEFGDFHIVFKAILLSDIIFFCIFFYKKKYGKKV